MIFKKINVILDKESGEPRLSHKIDLSLVCTRVENSKKENKRK